MDEIIGMEFDWYAVDKSDNIAMFAAGGSCKVPEKVYEFYKEYQKIRELIDEPNYGSEQVWQDHADVGFFVFETDLSGHPYEKQAEPAGPMDSNLKQKIMSLPNLPRYNISFRGISTFDNIEDWT